MNEIDVEPQAPLPAAPDHGEISAPSAASKAEKTRRCGWWPRKCRDRVDVIRLGVEVLGLSGLLIYVCAALNQAKSSEQAEVWLRDSTNFGRRKAYRAMWVRYQGTTRFFDFADQRQLDDGWRSDGKFARKEGSWQPVEIDRRARNPPVLVEAQTSFERAIEIARKHGAKSSELRAAISLARLLRETDRREEARQIITEIYGWFTEGFDTADLRDAKAAARRAVDLTDESCAARPADTRIAKVRSSAVAVALRSYPRARSVVRTSHRKVASATRAATASDSRPPLLSSLPIPAPKIALHFGIGVHV